MARCFLAVRVRSLLSAASAQNYYVNPTILNKISENPYLICQVSVPSDLRRSRLSSKTLFSRQFPKPSNPMAHVGDTRFPSTYHGRLCDDFRPATNNTFQRLQERNEQLIIDCRCYYSKVEQFVSHRCKGESHRHLGHALKATKDSARTWAVLQWFRGI